MENGICISAGDLPNKWDAKLKILGIRSVRIWGPGVGFNYTNIDWFVRNIKPWFDAGYDPIVCLTFSERTALKDLPTPAQATKFYSGIAACAKECLAKFELFNEPNLRQYNPKADDPDWASWLLEYIKVARQSLQEYTLIGPPCTFGGGSNKTVDKTKALIDAGLANYIDIGNVHLYADDSNTLIATAKAVKALYPAKPLYCTEWNISNPAKWTLEFPKAYEGLTPYLNRHYYYRVAPTSTGAGNSLNTLYPFNADGSASSAHALVQSVFVLVPVPVPVPLPLPVPVPVPVPVPKPEYHTIQVVTYRDNNGNGRREGSEAQPAITVKLLDSENRLVASKPTDKFGWAQFANVPSSGNYSLVRDGGKPLIVVLTADASFDLVSAA